MAQYDVIDEAIIDASPAQVWNALISELAGAGRWWVPHNTFSSARSRADRVGGETRVTVHTRGVDRRGLKLKFTARTAAVDPTRHLTTDYVSGVFRGSGAFTLVPLDGGSRTKLWMRFRAQPVGWLRVLAKVVDIGEEHSKATQNAFRQLAALFATRADRFEAVSR